VPAVHSPGAERRHLAVLGSPIAHSLSPVLHKTAYELLDLPYEYGRGEVSSGGLADFLDNLDDTWLGLSLTMPLKREVVPLLDSTSALVDRLGVANTVLLTNQDGVRRLAGYNTDVDGIVRAVQSRHDVRHERAAILGGGATAASALAAAAELEATEASLFLRDPAKAGHLALLADSLGVRLEVLPLESLDRSASFTFVISTLPGGVELPVLTPESPDAVLLDVAYDPWPSPLAAAWEGLGGRIVSGLDMLLEQAIGQIRLFSGRDQGSGWLSQQDSVRSPSSVDAVTETFRPARLRGIELGTGRPKVIVPLTSGTVAELAADIAALDFEVADVVELRFDHFVEVGVADETLRALETARENLPDRIPVLFTFRSKSEGGMQEISPDDYEELLALAAESGAVDAIDVEMFTELASLERIVNGTHEQGLAVVMSSHDFERTPPREQIVARLTLQQDLGADVVKIAVMPQSPADVLTLLQATDEFVRTKAIRPAITMAMGPLGVISRLAGETFGSAATFGSQGRVSAPGQVDAHALRTVLDLVHDAGATPGG
jgi:3-dehydroquinate dehydratase type I